MIHKEVIDRARDQFLLVPKYPQLFQCLRYNLLILSILSILSISISCFLDQQRLFLYLIVEDLEKFVSAVDWDQHWS